MPRQKSTHVDSPKAVGERLKAARERAGLSQRQLSFPGCSPAYISRIESGDRIPSLQLLRELGRLNVTEDYLATGAEAVRSRRRLVEAEVALRLDELEARRAATPSCSRAERDSASRRMRLAGLGQVAFRRGSRARRSRCSRRRSRSTARTSRTIPTSPTASAAPTQWSASSSRRSRLRSAAASLPSATTT